MEIERSSCHKIFRMAAMSVLVTVGNCELRRRLLAAHKLHDVTQPVQKWLHQTNKTTWCQRRIFLY